MIQNQENAKQPHFGVDLGPLDPTLGRHIFFFQISGFVSH